MENPLSIDEIRCAASAFKEDLMRQCKRCVRRGDNPGALSAIAAEEYIDQFVMDLSMRAHSRLRQLAAMPPRARAIRLPGQKTI